ncbi:hypothetical protein LEP1GSC173_3881 [Leptospira interrogans str. HAI1594]|uniref:Uncharacterized protein n=4 Tax=Leptospira interrogans TaxID=173 RepID=Q8F9S8_LEPIN|nr:hypothetical protein LA_0112 [Leptospira interrogans serovar Lai str. 56601]AAS68734.1 conserved hypothetical protein [Leptospira interrogans serovar Copenhageni str. Fiocruz L1-130]AER00920.1 hypothetical protein LIF_A0101 [Leptospira interrogans serovar Lai str. IPAV]ALE37346.1 hypothetical protein G436_0113 [Leptospira interrogans serovar Hardjo str. Norma]ALN98837.1 hypothetical protein LIH_00505 [Leptospira interrogans serovar Hardjo-prajitno]EKP74462.1 hypothetical protein LEP1GSC173_
MWELPQITILRTNSKIVGTHTFKKFFLIFLRRTHVQFIGVPTDFVSLQKSKYIFRNLTRMSSYIFQN